ncbi:MAG: hypothetical protein QOE90_3496 [Thermoplasmata archaeon]|jgi:hypothetical protein|nr:hypothetical protein [Thermoplasmata archaeon]
MESQREAGVPLRVLPLPGTGLSLGVHADLIGIHGLLASLIPRESESDTTRSSALYETLGEISQSMRALQEVSYLRENTSVGLDGYVLFEDESLG